MHPLGALFGDLLLRPVNREHVVLERDFHVLRLHTWQLGRDADRVGLLENVYRGDPRGSGVVAVHPIKVAERVGEEPADPALKWVRIGRRVLGHCEEHGNSLQIVIQLFTSKLTTLTTAAASWQTVCRPACVPPCQRDRLYRSR